MSAGLAARSGTLRQVIAGALSLLLVTGGLGLLAPSGARADTVPLDAADPTTPATVTADPLPTVQIDGVAWSQVVVGNTVYVAGKFANARPAGAAPGTRLTPRANLLAYDIRTGALVTSFAPSLNAQALVVTASPDGSRIYVGGDFTQANGQPRSKVAAYSTATGQLLPEFRPWVSGQVRAIAATDSTVYLGGSISSVGSAARNRLAAVTASSGALLPWAPRPGVGSTAGNTLPNNNPYNRQTSNDVMALVVAGNGGQVVAAGRFDSLNGVKATGVGALDGVTGATRPFQVNSLITNQGVNSAVYSLSTDGTSVFGTGYDFYGPGNLEGSFSADANGGAVRWINDCHGDTYATFATGGALYHATHAHTCGNIGGFPEQSPRVNMFGTAVSLAAAGTVGTGTMTNANFVGKPAPALQAWFPTFYAGTYTGQYQAGWTVTGTGQYVVYGGEFPGVNGSNQQGLVRFAVPALAPNKVAPRTTSAFTPTVAMIPGAARVSWKAAVDRDNEHLTYRVYRDGGSTPVCEVRRPSVWWNAPTYACSDTGAAAGSHNWRVTATDPAGNTLASSTVTANVPAGSSSSSRGYVEAVTADGAVDRWSLGESSGATAFDGAGVLDAAVGSGVVRRQAGAIHGDSDTAYSFSGTSAGSVASRTAVPAPQTVSVEAWFRTRSTAGGKIVGFGNAASGLSSSYDRHVFMDPAGRVYFGVHDGASREVRTSTAYNDGQWHHVVGTLSRQGLAMYVDGALVGTRPEVTRAGAYNGHWRIGGDRSWWVGADWFPGTIDEVAVYPTALSAEQVATHHRLGQALNVAPTASFTETTADLTARFDAAGSTDLDGTVASYAWDFGDGGTGTGAAPSHTYAAAGTYPVRLTVTDDDGATGTTTHEVTVAAPPSGPGSIAADTFGREVGSGWGAADTGGSWTTAGGATNSSVTGGTGRLTAPPGAGATATLAVDRQDVALQAALVVPKATTGSGSYVSLATRRGGTSDYRAKLWFRPTGAVQVSLVAVVAGAETALGSYTLPGGYTPGSSLTVRLETEGTGETTLRVKAWTTGTAEPQAWALTRTDAAAALQRPGALYVHTYSTASSTAAATVLVDDLRAEPAGTVTVAPNVAPTADFRATAADLEVTVDGAGSTDPDGVVASSTWDFGDGGTATGTTASHTYAAAGTYTVRLTVTDDDGATATTAREVTVTEPAPPPAEPPVDPAEPPADPAAIAADAFGREVTSGWGTAQVGGAWTTTGATASTSVTGGTGRLTAAPARNTTAALTGVSAQDVAVQADFSLDRLPTGGGTYVSLATRRVGTTDHRVKLWFRSTGQVQVMLVRTVDNAETILGGYSLPGAYTPGTSLTVRLEAAGTDLAVKAWATGSAEPAAWALTRTDTTAALQRPGGLYLQEYLSGSATEASTVRVDALWAGSPGTAPAAP